MVVCDTQFSGVCSADERGLSLLLLSEFANVWAIVGTFAVPIR